MVKVKDLKINNKKKNKLMDFYLFRHEFILDDFTNVTHEVKLVLVSSVQTIAQEALRYGF